MVYIYIYIYMYIFCTFCIFSLVNVSVKGHSPSSNFYCLTVSFRVGLLGTVREFGHTLAAHISRSDGNTFTRSPHTFAALRFIMYLARTCYRMATKNKGSNEEVILQVSVACSAHSRAPAMGYIYMGINIYIWA